jgi:hypothetical protein
MSPTALATWSRAVIMAGGADEKWTSLGGPGRRHFAAIGGERVIERQVRQLRERGVNDIVIVAPDLLGYRVPGAVRVGPMAAGWGREALSSRDAWAPTGRTILVYGDTLFTDAAMDTVVGFEPHDWQLFGRFGASSIKRYGEIFAISFWPEHHEQWKGALAEAFSLKARGITRRAGCWEGFRVLGGARGAEVSEHRRYPALMTEIDDATDDFDTPAELATLLDAWRQAGLLREVVPV